MITYYKWIRLKLNLALIQTTMSPCVTSHHQYVKTFELKLQGQPKRIPKKNSSSTRMSFLQLPELTFKFFKTRMF